MLSFTFNTCPSQNRVRQTALVEVPELLGLA